MKLTKDARIFTVDGKDLGNLNRFVLDPKTKNVSHIVFERGGLLDKEEYVISFDLVDHVDESGIHLRPLPVPPEDLQKFDDQKYIVTDERALLSEGYVSDDMVGRAYYYPPAPFGAAGYIRPDDMYVYNPPENAPAVTSPATGTGESSGVIKEKDYNIPEGTVALKEGAKVLSSDMKHIGDVEKIIVDPTSEQATHMLVTKGLLTKEKKLVPVDWVDRFGEEEVYLALHEDLINRLPGFEGK